MQGYVCHGCYLLLFDQSADLITFTEVILMKNFVLCAVSFQISIE